MAKVKLLFGNDLQGEFSLDKPEITVGRSRDCDILVDNLGVSRHHCSIVQKGDQWHIIDKGSNNGTFMNGNRVNDSPLQSNDQIVLGKFSLVYDSVGVAEPKVEEGKKGPSGGMGSEMTMFVDPEAIRQMQEKMADGNKAAVERMVLAIKQGAREVNCALIKSDTTLGKGLEADVPIKGLLVKNIQAKVIKLESGHRLISFGGMRAVRVNGVKIQEATLKAGDIITLAGTTMTYKKL